MEDLTCRKMPYNLSQTLKLVEDLPFIFKSFSNPCWLPILFSLTYIPVTPLLCLGSTLSQYTSNYPGHPIHPCNNAGTVADVFQPFGIFSVSQYWLEIIKGMVPGISNSWVLTDLFLVSLHLYWKWKASYNKYHLPYPSKQIFFLTLPCIPLRYL